MVTSKAKTVQEYLNELPPERGRTLKKVREIIKKNLPKGYKEGMYWGMITYYVPLSVYPKGYGGNPEVPLCYLSLAAQKNHYAVYLMGLYASPNGLKKLQDTYKKEGKKLDIGKGCLRFKTFDNLSSKALTAEVHRVPMAKFVRMYDSVRSKTKSNKK